MDGIHEMLKARTRTLHERVERRLNLPARLRTVEDLQQVLGAFYGYYAPIEAQLADFVSATPSELDVIERQKTALIVADLDYWNIVTTELPLCRQLPLIDSPSEMFGCMYVLEGATLGGQVIKRILEEKLSVTSENGGRFFTGYGDQVGTMWNEFRGMLSRYAETSPDRRESIVSAASQTFTTLDGWLSQRLPQVTGDR